MNENIAISIIVPVYNVEKYLRKCLDSVVNQTLKNVEIILVDDGSTDNSGAICKEYAAKDDRIIYFYKENEGLAAARQDGIERSHGEYVGFVDSDDWLELNMYERMYEVAVKENADVVFCNCFEDEDKKNPYYLEPGVYDRERIEKEILPRSLAGLTPKGANDVIRWCNWLRIYRMSLIKENGLKFGRGFRRSQDLQLTFETALYAQKYVSINDEYLYHNRNDNNGSSLSRGYTKNYWKLIRPLIDKLYEDVTNYKKQDLSYYMHLCAFFFAVNGVQNEYEKSSFGFFKKIRMLNEVVKDPVIRNAIKYVDSSKLNNYFRMVYEGIKGGNGLAVYYSYFRAHFRDKIYKPFARKLINGKITGFLFKKLK
ncbi:MAG: glycosyltransferase [Clostridia bacterium]|nr:glycosyltransferase [Clostridia bacterium]